MKKTILFLTLILIATIGSMAQQNVNKEPLEKKNYQQEIFKLELEIQSLEKENEFLKNEIEETKSDSKENLNELKSGLTERMNLYLIFLGLVISLIAWAVNLPNLRNFLRFIIWMFQI